MRYLLLLAVLTPGQDCRELQTRGTHEYNEHRYDQAALEFTRAVDACGATAPLLLALGQAQLLALRPADALATLDRVPVDGPDYVQALKVKAKALYLLRRDPEAEDALKRAAARATADAEIPYDLGRIYYQTGRHTEAAESFRRAIALDPRAYKAWDNLGLALEALGDSAQAQQHYLKAIALVHKDHPRYDVVYANFADLLIKLGNYQRAFDLAAEAAERNPERAAQLLSRRKSAREAGPRRSERALVRAGDRLERRLPRAVTICSLRFTASSGELRTPIGR